MSKNLFRFFKLLLFVIGTYFLGLFPELMGGIVEEFIKAQVGVSYTYWVLGIGIAVGLVYFWLEYKVDNTQIKENNPASNREIILKGTLKRYKNRIEQKLVGDLSFEIPLKFKVVKTLPFEEIHKKFIVNPSELQINDYPTLVSSFSERIRRLLILGEAGSGKSLLLLKIAIYLIEKAKDDEHHPIPIIINLSSWPYNQHPFLTWLEQQLTYSAGEIGVSLITAKELLSRNQILLLLDGLDEIDQDSQEKILNQINKYLSSRQNKLGSDEIYPEVIICSRPHNNQGKSIPVYGTVLINKLRQQDVRVYLDKLESIHYNNAGARLLEDFNRSSPLRRSLDNSFSVHIALSVYTNKRNTGQEQDEGFPQAAANTIEIDNWLLYTYIQQELGKLAVKTHIGPKKSVKTLSWVADKIGRYPPYSSTFEITNIHPKWLKSKKEWSMFFVFSACLSGIVLGLFTGLILDGIFGLFAGLSYGIFLAFMFNLVVKEYKFYEVISYDLSWPNFFRSLLGGVGVGTLMFIFFLLLFFTLSTSSTAIRFASYFGISQAIGSFLIFFFDKKVGRIQKVKHPYQRVFANIFRHELPIYILVVGIFILCEFSFRVDGRSGILVFFEKSTFVSKMTLGLVIGAILGIFSNSAIHLSLIYCFFVVTRQIPPDLIRFMKHTAKFTGILEQDGGVWRFRHLWIQNAFINWQAALNDSKD
ncbi:MAG: NACHT domain-containing protein [Bacteroidia bacterium]